jgi:hypothetical protein
MLKKVFLSLASLFLVWQTCQLLLNIEHFKTNSYLFSAFLGWIISLFMTGIFAFLTFAFPVQKLLPESYYHINHPNRLHKLFSFFQVDIFRKILLVTLWRNKNQRKNYFDGTRTGISVLQEQSMKSEFGHLIPGILLTGVTLYVIVMGQPILGLFIFFFNFVGNFYPVILQRHHRMRIQLLACKTTK